MNNGVITPPAAIGCPPPSHNFSANAPMSMESFELHCLRETFSDLEFIKNIISGECLWIKVSMTKVDIFSDITARVFLILPEIFNSP